MDQCIELAVLTSSWPFHNFDNFVFVSTFSIWFSTLWGIEADCYDSGSLDLAPRSLTAHEPAPVLEILITPSLHAGTARYTCSRTATIRSLDNDR